MRAEIHQPADGERATAVQAHRLPIASSIVSVLGSRRFVRWELASLLRGVSSGRRVFRSHIERLLRDRRRGCRRLIRRVRVLQCPGDRDPGKGNQCVAVGSEDREIRIGSRELAPEPGLKLGRVGTGKAAFARAEPQQEDLVVLRALQCQRATVGPVRQDVSLDLGYLQWLMQPSGIGGGEVGDQLPEEVLEVAHGAWCFDREGRLEIAYQSVKRGESMRWPFAFVPLAVGLAAPLLAQGICRPPGNSNEAEILANFAVPLAFAALAAPQPARAGSLRLTLEASYLPTLDAATRTATICRPGKGPENTDLLFAFPRPRVAIGLPGSLLLEGSWIPPVRLSGAKANLGAVALGRSFALGQGSTYFGVRVHATFGLIRAAITCDDPAVADPTSECYQGTRSDDHYRPATYGAEGSLGWGMAGGRFRPYVGGGVNLLRPRFQVHFVNRFGDLDNTQVEVNLTRGVAFGGVTWQTARGFGVGGEIYTAPADAVTARLALSYAWR
jgi:hypothetical protein